ncbi:uncharacterized protein KY384_005281 [Bacidia gigantensis]|uniref:uncharacterized protein n=1 Tax=Bacidia gigantensis TaxID=2732470 RepID=UPI001D054F90|nr:uncharacterized protein KY384_005281 [Bacidia gigantensis]KAG8529800.1 hypothetical protein KY384_005281 [Bacidia gigantensis]
MSQVLPHEAKISKEAKEAMQECATEFISFVTSEAAEIGDSQKRKTIAGNDVLEAIDVLGFEHYAKALKPYLNRYYERSKVKTQMDQAPKGSISASDVQQSPAS